MAQPASDNRFRLSPRWEYALLAGLVVVAALIRLNGLSSFPLNVDEAYNAVRVFWPQFDPWRPNLGAGPALYYLTGKWGMMLLGKTEVGARLAPFVLGLAAVPLAYLIGRRIKDGPTGLTAAALVAFSFTLAGYSMLWRQYGYQVTATFGLVYLACLAGDRAAGMKTFAWVGLIATVGLLMLLSHPAVFPAAGLGLVMLDQVRRADEAARRRLVWAVVGLALVGAVCFLATYFITIKAALSDGLYQTVNYKAFLVKNLSPVQLVLTAFEQTLTLLRECLPFTGQEETANIFLGLCLFLFALGLGGLTGSAGRAFLLAGGTALIAVAGAIGLSRYALMWRQLLFLAPLYLIPLAIGLVSLVRWLIGRRYRPALACLLVILVLLPARAMFKSAFIYADEGTKILAAKVAKDLAEGDTVVVAPESEYQFLFNQYDQLKDIIASAGLKGQVFPYHGPANLWGRNVTLISGDRASFDRFFRESTAKRVWLLAVHHSARKDKPLPSGWRTVGKTALDDPSQGCLWLLTPDRG